MGLAVYLIFILLRGSLCTYFNNSLTHAAERESLRMPCCNANIASLVYFPSFNERECDDRAIAISSRKITGLRICTLLGIEVF
jgi:hypothetical protein